MTPFSYHNLFIVFSGGEQWIYLVTQKRLISWMASRHFSILYERQDRNKLTRKTHPKNSPLIANLSTNKCNPAMWSRDVLLNFQPLPHFCGNFRESEAHMSWQRWTSPKNTQDFSLVSIPCNFLSYK